MDRPKVEIEEPGKGFSRVTVTFPEDARTTALNCAARLRRAASMAHGNPPQGVDPGVLDFEAGVLERLADRLTPPPARNTRDIETLADIIGIMRSEPLYNPHGDPALVEANKVLKNYADRIEAAAVRLVREERTEAIDEALAHAEEVRAEKCRNCERTGNAAAMRLCDELIQAAYDADICSPGDLAQRVRKIQAAIGPSPQGNAAALREALELVIQLSDAGVIQPRSRGEDDELCFVAMQDMARAALSAPARNCDVGPADEQARRFQLFCQQHRDIDAECSTMCPFVDTADINYCQAGWSQLPYEEGGAE